MSSTTPVRMRDSASEWRMVTSMSLLIVMLPHHSVNMGGWSCRQRTRTSSEAGGEMSVVRSSPVLVKYFDSMLSYSEKNVNSWGASFCLRGKGKVKQEKRRDLLAQHHW